MAVSKRTRFEVLRRDNYTCRYCRSVDNPLRVDHVTPVTLGGTDDPGNLVAACQDCNAGKASSTLDAETVADIHDDAVRWSSAMQQAAAILEAKASESDQYLGAFLSVWGMRYLPPTLEHSVARFYQMGLPESVMVDAALYATSARGIQDRGSYFAGICWKRIRAMREIAEQIVAGDDAP
jgi:hypothetical protein